MTRFCTLLTVAVIAVLLGICVEVVATPLDASGVSSEADGRWIINHPDERRIYAVQCGLDVTLFALKYFKIDYSLVRVSLGLPLTTDGISLADIRQMLQVYGHKAEARKGVSIRQIANRLNGEYIAIIPLGMGGGRNHYYIGAMDNNGIVQLVDVSRSVSPLIRPDSPGYNVRIEQRFAEAGGIVLFVRKLTEEREAISKSVKIVPDRIELGEFMIGGLEATENFSVSFEILNTGNLPILVSSIQASCGCTVPKWNGGIIEPGTTQTVDFTVIPGAWGRNEQQKMARVAFVDGSSLDVTIHGTGQTPVERQRIELSQYSATIEITDNTPRPEFDVRLARLTSYIRPINEITVTSDMSWLVAELREPEKSEHGDSERAELYARILTDDLSLLMANGEQRQRCTINVSGAEGLEPVTMSLEFFERDFFRLSQYFVTMPQIQSEPIEIQVTTEIADNPLSILEVSVNAPFLSIATDGKTGFSIGFKDDVDVVPGYYFATARIENARKRSTLVKVTIHVSAGGR